MAALLSGYFDQIQQIVFFEFCTRSDRSDNRWAEWGGVGHGWGGGEGDGGHFMGGGLRFDAGRNQL